MSHYESAISLPYLHRRLRSPDHARCEVLRLDSGCPLPGSSLRRIFLLAWSCFPRDVRRNTAEHREHTCTHTCVDNLQSPGVSRGWIWWRQAGTLTAFVWRVVLENLALFVDWVLSDSPITLRNLRSEMLDSQSSLWRIRLTHKGKV